MKFWIDKNIPRQLGKAIRQAGYETHITPRGIDDLIILKRAIEVNAVIVTRDKDFEQYVLREGRSCSGIIWLLPTPKSEQKELTKILLQVIEDNISILNTSFITLSLDTVEIKRLK
jgi:predicted nuclease of predicted toxin-antitoxin system